MSSVLDKICADKQSHIAATKAATPLSVQEDRAKAASKPRGFLNQLKSAKNAEKYGLICEVKKASPSKGLIRADFDPVKIAKAYQAGGASCLSVLTDIPYFQGDDSYLIAARNAVTLPVLRKDFMLDSYQVTEARGLGADCILLIMAALEDSQAQELEQAALHYGMDVLVEVHNRDEMERAFSLKSKLLGINNRNLKTLEVDINTTLSLAEDIPKEYTIVAESGLVTRDDLARCAAKNVTTFLIGESLMRQDDVTTATKTLMGA